MEAESWSQVEAGKSVLGIRCLSVGDEVVWTECRASAAKALRLTLEGSGEPRKKWTDQIFLLNNCTSFCVGDMLEDEAERQTLVSSVALAVFLPACFLVSQLTNKPWQDSSETHFCFSPHPTEPSLSIFSYPDHSFFLSSVCSQAQVSVLDTRLDPGRT